MASSLFPGMNPYLEAPGVWESFHHNLIVYTAAALNRVLPAPYVAVVKEWRHVLPPRQGIRPDVVIGDAPAPLSSLGSVALMKIAMERLAYYAIRCQTDQSSIFRPGTFWKSDKLRVRRMASLARAIAAIFKSIVPIRILLCLKPV